ncbi:hypothetical protein CBR_g45189 [Chara braunii]|uniref:Uncharacterized protein n=1 Tax=Chara braunii TaxID=69332 RepID=A0A388K3H5_CHABU|nr:hypothetical protein CBR_g45189 [Chara braunii]|eukprot:GBG64493.1 hypothetical protein CBR_g45189 [Chara braunii]
MEEEKVRLEKEKKEMEERLQKELEEASREIIEEEVEVQEEEEKTSGAETSTATHIKVYQGDDEEWVKQFGFHAELPAETEDDHKNFVARLERAADERGRNFVGRKKISLRQKAVAQKRKEMEEQQRLKEEGEKLQQRLKEQKRKEAATEEGTTLTTDTLLHHSQALAAIQHTLTHIECQQHAFQIVWNNFLSANACRIDERTTNYALQLDKLVTQKIDNTIAERKPSGGSGGGGNGGDAGKGGDHR